VRGASSAAKSTYILPFDPVPLLTVVARGTARISLSLCGLRHVNVAVTAAGWMGAALILEDNGCSHRLTGAGPTGEPA